MGSEELLLSRKRRPESARAVAADRLSDLPDSEILHILSFLWTKDAIKTGVLSKRWKFVWTSVPTLSFYSGSRCSLTKFRNFVERALILHHSPKLDQLLIKIRYDSRKLKQVLSNEHISLWLRHAINRDVATLHLDFGLILPMPSPGPLPCQRFSLPDFLYGHSSLTNLSTLSCDYVPKRRISWGSLRRLTIRYAELRDDVFSNILAGSPELEYLELEGCWGFQLLDIGSSCLNKLTLAFFSKISPVPFKISAPNLKSFEILGAPVSLELLNASALQEVKLNFRFLYGGVKVQPCERGTVLHLLQTQHARDANRVVLGKDVCRVLSKIDAIDQLSLPFKHTCLVIELGLEALDHAMANLLQNSPTLETLVINMVYPNEEFSSNHEKYWSSLKGGMFLCLQQALKNVSITGFKTVVLPFVQFLLMNTKVLEKISIYFMRVQSRKDATERSELVKMSKNLLLHIPRSSSKAVVEFHE